MLIILFPSPGSVATGLGIGGIASNAGAGQGGLGSIAAADTLAAHGSHNFGIGHPRKDLFGERCQISLLILGELRELACIPPELCFLIISGGVDVN